VKHYESTYMGAADPVSDAVDPDLYTVRGVVSPDRELRLVLTAKRLGVRPETLEEYFRTGIRLEKGRCLC